MIEILKVLALLCTAAVLGKLISRLKLPAILGWLITGMIFGPYLVGLVDQSILDSVGYRVFVKTAEGLAGIMIGSEIVFKKLARYGRQLVTVTLFQSLGTFVTVTAVFALALTWTGLPICLSFIFGGIALATAPAPALSIVNQYKTEGPVTKTLIPMAALDDVIGVIVFFSVISIVSSLFGGSEVDPLSVVLMIVLPLVIGIAGGLAAAFIVRFVPRENVCFVIFLGLLAITIDGGFIIDYFVFHSFLLNYLLIGMAFAATFVNLVKPEKIEKILHWYQPVLGLSLIIVIVNLGLPLDFRLIAGAGIFTLVYIVARALGKIGGAAVGGVVAHAPPSVTRYLGLTLLPHSGVSLVFTGIAASTIGAFNPEAAAVIQGTIAAAAILNEIIAVILARLAFKWAGELPKTNS